MATLVITNSFDNATIADALEVNKNFQDVKQFVETALVQVDGTVQLPSAAIADGAVTSVKIVDSAITSAKIADNSIVNADINSAAAIADSKLATIATAGKVSNSATTATNNNTASAIVARDGSGNFSAGTITANLNGTASFATNAGTATSATSATNATNATNATFATTAGTANSVALGNVSGIRSSTAVYSFTNLAGYGWGHTAVAHGLGVVPKGCSVFNGDLGAMSGLFVVVTADAANIVVRAVDYTSTFVTINGRVNWMVTS